MLAERPADIIISDQSMPEIKGTDFLAEVAAAYPSSYRVLLTGSVPLFGVMREIGTGVVQLFVPKPWMAEDMSRMLERAGAHFESGGGGR
jgi:DNA-binding NtrC family response regulator